MQVDDLTGDLPSRSKFVGDIDGAISTASDGKSGDRILLIECLEMLN